MRFETEAISAEIPAYLTHFVALIGAQRLQPHLENINRQTNSLAADYFRSRFELEITLARALKYRKATGRVHWGIKHIEEYRLFSFIVLVVRTHRLLNPKGKANLEGALKKSLDQAHGFSPLAFEMAMAGHLMASGFDVSFNDMEEHGRFDFLATKGQMEIEIECKFVSDDIGRKIHKKKFHDLAAYLKPFLDKMVEREVGGIFINLELEDRLHGNLDEFKKIRIALENIIDQEPVLMPGLKITRKVFELSELPFDSLGLPNNAEELVQDFINGKFGIANASAMLTGNLKNSIIIVSVTSNTPDEVIDGIYRKHLRAATEQLTGERVGVVCLYFPGLNDEKLTSLRFKESGISRAVGLILRKRTWLYGVALLAPGVVIEKRSTLINVPNITSETGPVVTYKNPFFSLEKYDDNFFDKIFSRAN